MHGPLADLAHRRLRIRCMKRSQLLLAPLGLLPLARSGGAPVALVTDGPGHALVAVDLTRWRVARRVPLGAEPRAVEAQVSGLALAICSHAGLIVLVDVGTLRVVGEIDGFEMPRNATIAGNLAYVAEAGREAVAIVDLAKRRVIHRVGVGGPARHLSISPDRSRVWTALGSVAPAVARLDLTTNPRRPRRLAPLRLDHRVHDVVFAPSSGDAWISSGENDAVAIVDPASGRVRHTFPAGRAPQHIGFSGSSRDRTAWVTSGEDGVLRRVSAGGETIGRQAVPVGSYNIDASWRPLTPSLDRGTLASPGRRPLRVSTSAHDVALVVRA